MRTVDGRGRRLRPAWRRREVGARGRVAWLGLVVVAAAVLGPQTQAAGELWVARYDGGSSDYTNWLSSANSGPGAAAVSPDGATLFVAGASWVGSNDYGLLIAYDASSGSQRWAARVDLVSNTAPVAVALSPSGSRAFFAATGSSANYGDVLLAGYDAATGTRLWLSRYDSGGPDYVAGLAPSPDGSRVFVTGWRATWTGSSYVYRFQTVAFDATTGARLWVAVSSDQGVAAAVAAARTGGLVVVAGRTVDDVVVAYDAATGAQRWVARYDSGGPDQPVAVAITPDGSRVVVTGTTGSHPATDYLTVAFDATTGARLWVARYDAGTDSAAAVAPTPDGAAVIVTGTSGASASPSARDFATVAYDAATGAQRWVARYDGGGSDEAHGLAVSSDGRRALVTGASAGTASGSSDYATVAYDPATGAQRWVARYDTGGYDSPAAVVPSPDGERVYLTGTTSDGSNQDILTLALSARRPPVAAFSISPSNPVAGETVTFTDASVDPDGSVVAWAWDFGDGAHASARNPAHAYGAAGTYSVTLTVTDDDGLTASVSQQVSVDDPRPRDLQAHGGPGLIGEITISWSAPQAASRVSAYRIYRSESAGGPRTLLGTVGPDVHRYTDGGLLLPQHHFYVVTAMIAGFGESPPSNEACGISSPWHLVPPLSC